MKQYPLVNIGYACINTQCNSPNRTCRLDRATPERLLELAQINLGSLAEILRWNARHGIKLFRISSETIPFGSHPVNNLEWERLLQPELETAAEVIRTHEMRVSLHPGQYTVLNSPRPEVVQSSLSELEYSTRLLDALGLDSTHRIILHLGGGYGDKPARLERFVTNFARLSSSAQKRITLENDEKTYTLADALELGFRLGAPVVFDVFHHGWNPSFEGKTRRELVELAATSWQPEHGRQKIHYSEQQPGKQPGSHSQTVQVGPFLVFLDEMQGLPLDIMLEVKDKEQSVLKVQSALEG